ncbi:MAG TPA: toprim domain-containing protein [Gemmatimonadaceae bacterium]|nr:toprim domain-containing protein [Gemmatimonadaceae bacterium]
MSGRVVATYTYPDERGRVLLRKRRFDPKDFRMQARKAENCVWVRPLVLTARYPKAAAYFDGLLFNLRLLLEDPPRLALTEGEKDAQWLTAAGLPTLSHWGGAQHFTAEQANRFRSYRGRLILVADKDPAGAADVLVRYRRLLAVGVPARRVRIVRAAGGRRNKDAADHIAAGYGPDEFVPVDMTRLHALAAAAPPPGRAGRGYDPAVWATDLSTWRPTVLTPSGEAR